MMVHLDIDAFFASVEQQLVPALRGRPVAVGSGCIASCSYEARAKGLRAGMSLAKARRLCPGLVVMPGSYGVYRCFAAEIWDLCREVAPAVETYLDDAYLDLSGTRLLYGDPRRPVAALRARVRERTGLVVTAGIGPNRMVARLASASAKPDGMRLVAADEVEDFIRDRPVGDIPGVGPKTAAKLAKLAVRTVRDLRRLSREELMAMFGRNGSAMYDRARGLDTRAISEREVPKTISRETTFHKETTDPAEVAAMLHYLVERAMKAVRELGLVARGVLVKVCYADFRRDDARTRLRAPARLEGEVFDAVAALFERLHTRRVALRNVGVVLSGLSLDDADQMSLLEEDEGEARRERLAEAVDDLRARYGFAALTAGKSVDLLGRLRQDDNGYVLRTPCLTK
ncbi:MAG: DNA polymerase IV [Planctomycetota bacterium]|jgi:DNA polymerase-4